MFIFIYLLFHFALSEYYLAFKRFGATAQRKCPARTCDQTVQEAVDWSGLKGSKSRCFPSNKGQKPVPEDSKINNTLTDLVDERIFCANFQRLG